MTAAATLASVVRDSITNCPDLDPYWGDTRLLGDIHDESESWKLDFWIRFFCQDAGDLARYLRVANAPAAAFRDLVKLEAATTGRPVRIPPALLELLRQRVTLAYFPNADQVVRLATHGSALYAQRCLQRYIAADEWHARVR